MSQKAEQLSIDVFPTPSALEQKAPEARKEAKKPKPNRSKENLAPMLKSYVELCEKYPEHVILYQVGDFYEVFFENAESVSDVLGIRLTARHKEQPNPVPMCGVPIHAIDNYLPKILEAGLSVVVVSQSEDGVVDKKAGVKREIDRIVTPGVRFEGDGLEENSFNFLAAACFGRGTGALAYTDVSTGLLQVFECESEEELIERIRLISPSEIIFPSTFFSAHYKEAALRKSLGALTAHIVKRPFEGISKEEAASRLPKLEEFKKSIVKLSPVTLACIETLLKYVEEISFSSELDISTFRLHEPSRTVVIDSSTAKNLELVSSISGGGRKNSLLGVLDRTKTAMGSRLLKIELLNPSSSETEINSRHDAVEFLLEQTENRQTIREALQEVRDLERLATRVSSLRASPRDLRVLADSLACLPKVKAHAKGSNAELLVNLEKELDTLEDVVSDLQSALVEEPPPKMLEGGIFSEGYNKDVDFYRSIKRDGRALLSEFEDREKSRSGIQSLKVKFNNVFGYFIEISKANAAKAPDYYERKQTLTNAERYITPELKELEEKILSAKSKQIELEKDLFKALRLKVNKEVSRIQKTAGILSKLDVLCSAAQAARECNFIRPEITTDSKTEIIGGRHPVVEQVVGLHRFVPNDVSLDAEGEAFAVLTGPNMGGKSTYLRQLALIQLMAQAGQFVPATSARLGIVDRVFTRIGASDDLSQGESTFMVEMREASTIVRKASKSSLVLVDELGRGTATADGFALARSIAEFLYDSIGCRTIFATHFHELTMLNNEREGIFCLSVGATEEDGQLNFSHRVEKQIADKSYGIEVARLAGLPELILARASVLLDEQASSSSPKSKSTKKTQETHQKSPKELEVLVEVLKKCDLNRLTPIEALGQLDKIKTLVTKT